jgi:hypothetical protein
MSICRDSDLPNGSSHDPPLQSLEPFLEAALLGPVALGDRIGEGERQRIAGATETLARRKKRYSGIAHITDLIQAEKASMFGRWG